jgi:hypothetical protein
MGDRERLLPPRGERERLRLRDTLRSGRRSSSLSSSDAALGLLPSSDILLLLFCVSTGACGAVAGANEGVWRWCREINLAGGFWTLFWLVGAKRWRDRVMSRTKSDTHC